MKESIQDKRDSNISQAHEKGQHASGSPQKNLLAAQTLQQSQINTLIGTNLAKMMSESKAKKAGKPLDDAKGETIGHPSKITTA